MKRERIGTLEAKTHLSTLLEKVQRGSRFVITKHGKPIAELGPVEKRVARRRAGFAKGVIAYVAPDFDRPLTDFAEYQ